MTKRFLSILPLVLFLLVILWVFYKVLPISPGTATSTGIVTTSSPTPTTISPSPTPIITPTHTASPSPTPSPTDTPMPSSTNTPTPTDTHTPTPIPTPTPFGIVVEKLTVRSGPDINYDAVAYLEKEDQVTILGRTEFTDWLEIKIPNSQKTGWVDVEYIEIRGDLNSVEIKKVEKPKPLPPTNESTQESPVPPSNPIPTLIPGGESVYGEMKAYETKYYIFTGLTKIFLIFKPKEQVELVFYDKRDVHVWPPDPNTPNKGIGHPPYNWDNDLTTGELTWEGGTPDFPFYLSIVNKSGEVIEYCLAPSSVNSWSCR